MKNVWKTFLCLALTLCGTVAQAQHFDWVTAYRTTRSTVDAMIRNMDVDSRGNIYFIGSFSMGGTINGVELMPGTIQHTHNYTSLCIVKMSPSGEVLWHKAVSSWDGHLAYGNVQVVGDSAVMCYIPSASPGGANSPAYWLDSLVQYPDWFVPTDSIGQFSNALLTFDLDGNLKEQHFLNLGVLDTLGEPVAQRSVVAPQSLTVGNMHIDSDGNIILQSNCCNDKAYRPYWCDTCEPPTWRGIEYSVENGGVGAVRVMVDGTRSFFHYPENRPILTNAKLLKFSPHFDSLLGVRYLMQPRLDSPRTGYGIPGIQDTRIMHIDSDPEGNLYVVGYIDALSSIDSIVPIDSAQGMTLRLNEFTGFLVKYDPQLRPIYVKQLDGGTVRRFIHCKVTDDDLFVLGGGGDANPSEVYYYEEDTLRDIARGALLLRLNKDDGSLLSYGKARPSFDNETWPGVSPSSLHPTLAVHNNRVAMQVKFLGNIAFAGDTARVTESPYRGIGAVMWDYDGHELNLWNHHASHPDSEPIGALFTDSSLYFSGMFIGQATFGDTSFSNGLSNAYLARYVDNAFLVPYVHPDTPDTGDVRIVMAGDGTAMVVYPNPCRQRVTIRIENGGLRLENGVATAWLTDLQGRREEVVLTATGNNQYTLDLTSRPQAAYLLTLTTADGRQHTVRLLKLSNVFRE